MVEGNNKKKAGKKILFLSPYPFNRAPSQRLKYEQYYTIFKENGYELTTSSFMDEKLWSVIYLKGNFLKKISGIVKGYKKRFRDIFRVGKFDLVYIHLWVTPIGGTFFERMVRNYAKKIVYDIDDMIFLGHSSDANLKLSFIKGKKKPLYLIKNADHVISCTPKLNDFVQKYNNKSTDISSTIDTLTYSQKTNYEANLPLVIGWSGSHSTSKYLHLLQNVFIQINKKHNVIFKVIGDEKFRFKNIITQSQKWIPETEVKDLKSIDIGVYPLPDEPWVYGKSGLKALQYMALGIPTVASNIGANKRIIQNGVNGFLVNTEQEWIITIENLINNKELRKKIGTEGRETVQKKFSIQANQEKYLKIFKTLIDQ